MVRGLAMLSALAVAFAGCLGQDDMEDHSKIAETLRSWNWNLNLAGPGVLQMLIVGDETTECEVAVGFRSTSAAAVLLEWGDGRRYRLLSEIGREFGAHIEGIVDTREGSSGNSMSFNGSYSPTALSGGMLTMTVLSEGFAPEESHASASMWLRGHCDGDVRASYTGSDEVLILLPTTSPEGGGLWLPSPLPPGVLSEDISVLAHGAIESTFATDVVSVRGDSRGLEYGRLGATGPGIAAEWDLAPAASDGTDAVDALQIFELDAGAGAYRLELDRVSGLYQSFWAALYGLDRLESPKDLL